MSNKSNKSKFEDMINEETFLKIMKEVYKYSRVNTKAYLNNYGDMDHFNFDTAARATYLQLSYQDSKDVMLELKTEIGEILFLELIKRNTKNIITKKNWKQQLEEAKIGNDNLEEAINNL